MERDYQSKHLQWMESFHPHEQVHKRSSLTEKIPYNGRTFRMGRFPSIEVNLWRQYVTLHELHFRPKTHSIPQSDYEDYDDYDDLTAQVLWIIEVPYPTNDLQLHLHC